MKDIYCDFHTHTNLSDGNLTPQELVDLARKVGIGVLAITDHNSTMDLYALRRNHPDINLVQGTEISCSYIDSTGLEREIHIPALGFDPDDEGMKALLRHNQPDRRPYVEEILEKLRCCGIDLGTYEDIGRTAPDSNHFGRMQIAKVMQNRGYVSSVNEAFDKYIGSFGQRLAYVPNPLRYVTMEETIHVIRQAGGQAVLAHLYYYQLDAQENRRLVRRFREMGGTAMETEYSIYTRQQRDALYEQFARPNGLMISCASDFHGVDDDETLDHRFRSSLCAPLMEALGVL